jgi:hypothetical protein
MQDIEKKLIAQIRTRLANKGHSGFTADEIRKVINDNFNVIEDINDEGKAWIVDQLIAKRNQGTPIESYPATIPPESVETTEEQSPVIEEQTSNEPDMMSMLSTVTETSPDPVSMVRQEAASMGVSISDTEVNNIAQQVQQSQCYNQDQIGAIKEALIAFVDWQHSQTSTGLNQAIAQVSSHASSRQAEFNNQMVGEVNNFFRVSQQNSQNTFASILGALQIPGTSV